MTAPLRMVLVGLGGFGQFWAQHLLPEARDRGLVDPVAAVDTDATRFGVATAGLGLPAERCFTSLDDALSAVDADAVAVVVPPAHHEGVVRTAVAAGLHVLCEKPLADSLEASIRMSRLVDEAGLKMAVTMSHRMLQDKQSLQRLLDDRALGDLGYLVVSITSNSRYFGDWGEFRHRMADPLLVEQGVHQLDILRGLSRSDAQTVYARSWNPRWGEYAGDSAAFVTIEMLSGVHCSYEGSKSNASSLHLTGAEYIRAECESGTAILNRGRLRVVTGGWDGLLTERDVALSTSRHHWGHAALIEDFCRWIDGGPAPETEHHDNLQACALLYAVIESAHSGRPVDVQEFLAAASAAVDAD